MKYYFSLFTIEDFDSWHSGQSFIKFLEPEKRSIPKLDNGAECFIVPYIKSDVVEDKEFLTFEEYREEIEKYIYNIGAHTPISFKSNVGVVIGYFIDD